jgi:hypothetical protein
LVLLIISEKSAEELAVQSRRFKISEEVETRERHYKNSRIAFSHFIISSGE